MKTVTIEGQLRTGIGKSAARQLRSQDLVPGVIYGGAKEVNFAATAVALKPFVYTSDFQKIEIKVDGKTYTCILKDLQFNKVTDKLTHIDLLELVEDKKVKKTLFYKLLVIMLCF
jgi:large subunit ribosomal protein L25